MNQPRIVIVIGKLDRGGTELHLLRTMPEVAARGVAISVFALYADGTLSPAFRAAGIDVVAPLLAEEAEAVQKHSSDSQQASAGTTNLGALLKAKLGK